MTEPSDGGGGEIERWQPPYTDRKFSRAEFAWPLIIRAAAAGASDEEAAYAGGMSPRRLYAWLRDPDMEEPAFRYRQAKAAFKMRLCAKIRDEGGWRGAQFLLACRDPDNYSPDRVAKLAQIERDRQAILDKLGHHDEDEGNEDGNR